MSIGAGTSPDARRAHDTWQALRRVYDSRRRRYHEPATARLVSALHLGRLETTSLWPYANAWAAALTLARLDSVEPRPAAGASGARAQSQAAGRAAWREVLEDHRLGLAPYALHGDSALDPDDRRPLRLEAGTVRPPGRRGDAYYDDCAWIALDLLAQRAWLEGTAGEAGAASICEGLARRVLAFVLTGWRDDASLACPGGIAWAEPEWSRTRNACSSTPAAEAALLLHRIDGDPAMLGWSVRIVEWVDATLAGAAGLVRDRVEPDGTVHGDLWAYNQGTMIGARVLLHEACADRRHLDRAAALASASAEWLSDPAVADHQGAPFMFVYLRNLLLLAPYGDVSLNLSQVGEWAERAWQQQRDAASGLFGRNRWEVNATAAAAGCYALLAGAPTAP